jgi:hypothetical protein
MFAAVLGGIDKRIGFVHFFRKDHGGPEQTIGVAGIGGDVSFAVTQVFESFADLNIGAHNNRRGVLSSDII